MDAPADSETRYRFYQTVLVILVLVVVAIGGWIGYQASIVYNRAAARKSLETQGADIFDDDPGPSYLQLRTPFQEEEVPSYLRLFLGDRSVAMICVADKKEMEEAEEAFPEAIIVLLHN